MVVRVRVRAVARSSGRAKEIVVLANGGAESPRPCLVVDPSVAADLGLWPPSEAEEYYVEEASSISRILLLRDAIVLELLGERGEVLSRVVADLAVQEGLVEPLITDITIDELGIQVLSFSRGLWRHRGDKPGVVRRSPSRSG